MEEEDWYSECSELLDGAVDSILEKQEKSTPADVGLVMRILEDYIESDGDNIGRNVRAIEVAKEILNHKYNADDLSWFDIYSTVMECNSSFKGTNNGGESNINSELNEIFKSDNIESSHTREFEDITQRLFETLDSEKAEELQNNPPKDLEGFNHLSQSVGTKVGFLYGSVEIPNNLSRMKIAGDLTERWKDLNGDDYRWIMRTISEWLRIYARAEATISNRNISQEELNNFMITEETPSERYWT